MRQQKVEQMPQPPLHAKHGRCGVHHLTQAAQQRGTPFQPDQGVVGADLEGLGEEVRRRVRETTGITLEWEIKRLGTGGTR